MSAERRITGCYFLTSEGPSMFPQGVRQYIPQTKLESYTHILSTTATTTLKQEFFNGSEKFISQLMYEFPIFAGVSVVEFKAQYGKNTTLKGVVRSNAVAKATYEEAKESGKKAAIMEYYNKSGDIFTTKLANIPPKSRVVVELKYVENLKQDFGKNGHRFTLPTSIAPRYGKILDELVPTEPKIHLDAPMKVVVDVETVTGNHIRRVGCPSHTAVIHNGFLSTEDIGNGEPSFSKAHVTLTNSEIELGKDFVLQIETAIPDASSAILETFKYNHNLKAIRATVVPSYKHIVVSSRERDVVLLCDRSGSMGLYGGSNRIGSLREAAKYLLPSLRVLKNTFVNIVSFGSSFSSLWEASQSLIDSSTYQEARRHVTSKSFDASYGGTNLDRVFRHIFETRNKERDLEIILLTDAEYEDVYGLTAMVKEAVDESENAIRIFTLGIGETVSHELIQDLATVSNGFSLAALDNEPLAEKTMVLMQAVDAPHVRSHQVSLKHEDGSITQVTDGYFVAEGTTVTGHSFFPDDFVGRNGVCTDIAKPSPQRPDEFAYDSDINEEGLPDPTPEEVTALKEAAKYVVPSIIQAPTRLPVLSFLSSIPIHLLLRDVVSPVTSIIVSTSLTGTESITTEVPITTLSEPGEIIHQLAAKVLSKDLETEGGWLANAGGKEKQNVTVGLFNTEQVRLGVHLGVANKQASLVAVEDVKPQEEATDGDTTMEDVPADEAEASTTKPGAPENENTLDCDWEFVLTDDDDEGESSRGFTGFMGATRGGGTSRGLAACAPPTGAVAKGGLFGFRSATVATRSYQEKAVVPESVQVDLRHVRVDDPVDGLLDLQDSNSWAWIPTDDEKDHISHYCRLEDYDAVTQKVAEIVDSKIAEPTDDSTVNKDTILCTVLVLAYLQAKHADRELFWSRPATEAIKWLSTQFTAGVEVNAVIEEVVGVVFQL